MGFDWNPESWIKDAFHDAAGLPKDFSDLWHWVVNEDVKLGSEITTLASDAWNNLHSVVVWVDGKVHLIDDAIWRGLGKVGGDITGIYHWIINQVTGLIKAAEAKASRLVSIAWAHADNLYHDLLRTANALIRAFYHKVFLPAFDGVRTAIRDAVKETERAADLLYHDVLLKAAHDAEKAYAEAVRVARWVDHAGYDAVKLVEKSWDWLEAFAAHPFHELESVPGSLAHLLSGDWATAEVRGLPSVWDALASGLEEVYPHASSGAPTVSI